MNSWYVRSCCAVLSIDRLFFRSSQESSWRTLDSDFVGTYRKVVVTTGEMPCAKILQRLASSTGRNGSSSSRESREEEDPPATGVSSQPAASSDDRPLEDENRMHRSPTAVPEQPTLASLFSEHFDHDGEKRLRYALSVFGLSDPVEDPETAKICRSWQFGTPSTTVDSREQFRNYLRRFSPHAALFSEHADRLVATDIDGDSESGGDEEGGGRSSYQEACEEGRVRMYYECSGVLGGLVGDSMLLSRGVVPCRLYLDREGAWKLWNPNWVPPEGGAGGECPRSQSWDTGLSRAARASIPCVFQPSATGLGRNLLKQLDALEAAKNRAEERAALRSKHALPSVKGDHVLQRGETGLGGSVSPTGLLLPPRPFSTGRGSCANGTSSASTATLPEDLLIPERLTLRVSPFVPRSEIAAYYDKLVDEIISARGVVGDKRSSRRGGGSSSSKRQLGGDGGKNTQKRGKKRGKKTQQNSRTSSVESFSKTGGSAGSRAARRP